MLFCKKYTVSSILSVPYLMKFPYVCFLLLCITSIVRAQPKVYVSFRDYFVVNTNPDSLEKAVYARKGEPVRYLHDLIWLEYSRYKVSNHFGNDLATIQKSVSQQHSGIAAAMYHYIMGLRYKSEDSPKSLDHFQKAFTYFERTKDTSGLAHCHLALMRLNVNNYNDRIGDTDNAKYHYDKTVELVQKSSDERIKISLMPRYLAELDLFYKPMSLPEVAKEYEKILQLVRKHPEMKFMLKDIYLNLSFFYVNNGDYKIGIEKLNLSLKHSSHCSPYNQITIYSNLAAANEGLGNFAEMENNLKKVLSAATPKIPFHEYATIEANYGIAIAILEDRKIEGVVPYLNTYETLKRAYTERLKIKELLNLQTKYETEKKEATIKALKLDKEQAENRNRLILGGLFLAVLIIGMIGFLALRLRRTNAELHNLQQSRDKLYTVIAHDLREPINSLTSVGTLLRYLIKHNRSAELETVTQQIDRMGQQTSLLLNNLLEWGKNNYFEQESSGYRFDAAPLLTELARVYEVLAEAKGVTVMASVPESYLLTANPKDLSLIVRNLLDNSLKHTPKGGMVWLTATRGVMSSATGSVIVVKDTGNGIAADQLFYLQQVFAGRVKPQVGAHGLGLGLVLINDFTRKNGAAIHLSSQEGKGTAFSIILP